MNWPEPIMIQRGDVEMLLSRLNLTADASSCSANGTASCPDSPSGMTSAPSTGDRGEGELMSSAEGSHVRTSALPEKAQALTENGRDCGERWREWFAKWDRHLCLWKTRQPCLFAEWGEFSAIWPRWGMMRLGASYHVETPEGFTYENGSGFLLPTIGKNEFKGASSVRFWGSEAFRGAKMAEGVRTSQSDPIYLSPSFSEEAMMWPITWTASAPLAMAKFQQWLHSHGEPS